DFTAVINWGDSHITAGTVTETGSTFEVSDSNGLHSYAANGPYQITVMVTDDGGSTVTTPANAVTDYDAVITCSSSCSGTATNSQQSTGASSSSTTGTILLDLNNTPAIVGAFSCGDPFRHAPQYSTILASGLTASGSINLSVSFANSAAGGVWWVPFAVCYDAPGVPFTNAFGHTT